VRGGVAAIREADLAKVAAIREAQEAGVVSSRFSAEHLLVINTASMWSVRTVEIAGLSGDDHARRGVVVEAVRVLVSPWGLASPRSRDYFDAFPSLSRLERRLDKDGKARRALRIGVKPGVWSLPWLRASA